MPAFIILINVARVGEAALPYFHGGVRNEPNVVDAPAPPVPHLPQTIFPSAATRIAPDTAPCHL
jgi:hypothetical protein